MRVRLCAYKGARNFHECHWTCTTRGGIPAVHFGAMKFGDSGICLPTTQAGAVLPARSRRRFPARAAYRCTRRLRIGPTAQCSWVQIGATSVAISQRGRRGPSGHDSRHEFRPEAPVCTFIGRSTALCARAHHPMRHSGATCALL
eukprot:IDg20537t1